VTVVLGLFLARGTTLRINRLANAINLVAAGNLDVRVPVTGSDELTELARVFNRMLGEMQQSRARIEYLQRIGAWQEMAQRLAHEIKNPLTPIQLAVEECHRRYRGDDADYRRILQTTLEVVGEEVASLRRLVSEFSGFARLPRAELLPGDLADFLRDQAARLEATDAGEEADDRALFAGVDLSFDVPEGPMPAVIDLEMLHRVLTNVVRNAAQAIRDAHRPGRGEVRVSARVEGDRYAILVDDDGPGIPPEVEQAIFDPYVTTKRDGTGLGLSIVKKIVMDHGGMIDAAKGPLGGARIRILLPRAGSAEARAALERQPESMRVAQGR
jgi:two-component system nitrogen regulation sensor histidine kinase NtrY